MATSSKTHPSASDSEFNTWHWENKTISRAPHPDENRIKRVRSMPSLGLKKSTIKPQRYPYSKLPGHYSIRLLHISLIDRDNYAVYGWLQEVDNIEDVTRKYLALSYTWGPSMMKGYAPDEPFRPRFRLVVFPTESKLDKVTCPSSSEMEFRTVRSAFTTHYELPLTQNLSDFFLTVDLSVSLGGEDGSLPLWIDALCINQKNSAEVDQQVMLMGSIYSLCRKTLVWLGPESHDLDALEWILGEAGEALMKQRSEEDGNSQGTAEQSESHFKFLLRSGTQVIQGDFWKGLDVKIPPLKVHGVVPGFESVIEKYTRPGTEAQTSLWLVWVTWCRFFNSRAWFHRAWVMQEVANLPGAFLIAGTLHFSWERLFDIDRFLCWSGYYTALGSLLIQSLKLEDKVHGPEYDMFLAWYRILYKLNFPDEVQKLMPYHDGELFAGVMEVVMRHSWKKKSTVARDKYACILGIARRTLGDLPVPPLLVDGLVIPPDATAPETFLYLQKLFLIADQYKALCLLRLVHHSTNESMMASTSWVINWSAEDVPDPFDYARQRLSAGGIDVPQTQKVNVASSGMVLCNMSGDSLCVYAVSLSKLTASFRTRVARVSHALSAILEILSMLGPTYEKTGEPLEAALFAVMTASNSAAGFDQSLLEHFCNVISNTTIVGLSALWEKGLMLKQVTVEGDIKYWSLSAKGGTESSDVEDYIRMDRFPKPGDGINSPATSNLVMALHRAGMAISMAIAYITKTPREEVADWLWDPEREPEELVLQAYHRRILHDRALFVTDDGFLGLGPGIAQAGDELCLIAGRSAPCILRPVPDSDGEGNCKYWFVGEVWAHGLMDGQGVTDEIESRFKTVELV